MYTRDKQGGRRGGSWSKGLLGGQRGSARSPPGGLLVWAALLGAAPHPCPVLDLGKERWVAPQGGDVGRLCTSSISQGNSWTHASTLQPTAGSQDAPTPRWHPAACTPRPPAPSSWVPAAPCRLQACPGLICPWTMLVNGHLLADTPLEAERSCCGLKDRPHALPREDRDTPASPLSSGSLPKS